MTFRMLEIGIACLVVAILNTLFGRWIDATLAVVGIILIIFAFFEQYQKAGKVEKPVEKEPKGPGMAID